MRGEEMMVFGYLNTFKNQSESRSHLLCLPGTHSKWIEADQTHIRRFQTVPTGELFALFKQAPLLGQGCRKEQADDLSLVSSSTQAQIDQAFYEGI